MVLAYTPGREVKRDEAVNAMGDEDGDGDEPVENWKVLKPEERQTVPEDQWVWRWTKMSKSKGNVVTPDEMAVKYGADSLRLFTLFVAPYEDNVQWTDKGIEAAHRFVNRIWRIWTDLRAAYRPDWRTVLPELTAQAEANRAGAEDQNRQGWGEDERKLRRKLHQTLRKIGEDLEIFRFNTAVAALMELTNELSAYRNALGGNAPSEAQTVLLSEMVETLPLLVSPIMPHLADEWWERLGKEGSTFKQPWPTYDPAAAAEDSVEIVVQVNGKIRERLQVPVDTPKEEMERLALACERVRADLNGKQVRKLITVPGRLVNIVIG
jgi:leucyl-tRNA synthetase